MAELRKLQDQQWVMIISRFRTCQVAELTRREWHPEVHNDPSMLGLVAL